MRGKSRWRRNALIGLAVALALLVAFEVSIRQITPDAVQYQIVTYPLMGHERERTGVVTDPATIATWRAAVSAQSDKRLWDAYLSDWSGAGCSYGTITSGTLRFTWHGLPVEVASPGPGCAWVWLQVSSGGLPDPHLHLVDFQALLEG